jgi:YD repeat-containing protein
MMTYPTGTTLTMTCDSANRVKSVKVGSDVIVQDVVYHPSGQVASMTYGNGKTTLVTYDDRSRTVGVTAADVIDLAYGYDGVDNVKSFENRAVTGSARTMTYDALDRLESTTAPGLWCEAYYEYDALGNRTYKSVGGADTTFGYDAQNRFASASTDILTSGSMAFTWDDANRLVSSSDGAIYLYDGHDRRIEKAEATQTTVYHYSPAGQVIAETLPDGTRLREYFYLGNKLIAVDGCVAGTPPCSRHALPTPSMLPMLSRESASIAFDHRLLPRFANPQAPSALGREGVI